MRAVGRIVAFLVVCAVVSAAGAGFVLDGIVALLFGWVAFVLRRAPQVEVAPAAVASGVAFFALFAIGLHLMGRRLAAPGEPDGGGPRRWSPRTTGALAVLLLLGFAAGTAAVGAVHQATWLVTSKRPLLTDGGFGGARGGAWLRSHMLSVLHQHREAAPRSLRSLQVLAPQVAGAWVLERYDLVAFALPADQGYGLFAVPRDPQHRQDLGLIGLFLAAGEDGASRSLDVEGAQLAGALAVLRAPPGSIEALVERLGALEALDAAAPR